MPVNIKKLAELADTLVTLGLCAMVFACGDGVGAGYMTKTALLFQVMGGVTIVFGLILETYTH